MTTADVVLLHQIDVIAADIWRARIEVIKGSYTSPTVRKRCDEALKMCYDVLKDCERECGEH